MSNPVSPWNLFPHPMPEGKPDRLAREAIRSLDERKREGLLRYLLTEWVAGQQRAEAKRIERRGYKDDRTWWRNHRKEVDRLRVEEPDQYRKRYTIGGIIETFEKEVRDEIRLEVTAELLGTSFALGDGRTVTWGEATVTDHQDRLKVLGDNVMGNLTTMVLHEQAIDMLQNQGVACLAQAPVEAVAA